MFFGEGRRVSTTAADRSSWLAKRSKGEGADKGDGKGEGEVTGKGDGKGVTAVPGSSKQVTPKKRHQAPVLLSPGKSDLPRPPVKVEHLATTMKIEPVDVALAEAAMAHPIPATTACTAPVASASAVPLTTFHGTLDDALSSALGSAMPADAAAPASAALDDGMPSVPASMAIDRAPSGSSGSGSSGHSGTQAPALAVVASAPADTAASEFTPAKRMVSGCRTAKTGLSGVELSKSNRASCQICKSKIGMSEVRFIYWHATNKPWGYIHAQCIVSVPLPGSELKANLAGLSPIEPILQQAVSDAIAALDARAY